MRPPSASPITALSMAAATVATAGLSAPAQDPPAVERVARGFRFVEGPAWDPVRQRLVFSDIPADRIYAYDGSGEPAIWREPSGNSNGLVFDADGNLYACCHGTRNVVRIAPDGTTAVVADRHAGKRLNSPNDCALDDHGGLWFTDPRYGDASDVEQDVMAVYYVARDGAVTRAIDSLQQPNGILLSRDGSGLYVAQPSSGELWFFPVLRPGVAGPGRVIFTGDPELDGRGPDGMAMDARGRLYTTYRGIVVHEPDGRVVRRIPVPERPANCVIGGRDATTLWITARTGLYRTRVDATAAPLRRTAQRPTVADAASAPLETAFERQVIDAGIGIGYGVAVADVDGDGEPDVVLVDRGEVVWYRNPTWQKHVLAERLTEHDHVCVAARDIDGDGKAELAVGAGWNPADTVASGSLHALAPPDDRSGRWQPVKLHHEPTVHRARWVAVGDGFRLVVAPLHGRGNRNAKGAGARLLAYTPPGDWPRDRSSEWPTELVSEQWHETHNVDPVQWDDDADEELLVAAREGLFLCDRGADGTWRHTALTGPAVGESGFRGASEVRAGRLPGGARFVAAIEPFHGNELVLYREPETGSPRRSWVRTVLADDLAQGHALACGDLLGDGSDQIVVGWRRRNPGGTVGIRVYAPSAPRRDRAAAATAATDAAVAAPGPPRPMRVATIDAATACEDLRLADLDGDGRLDVVAAGRDSHDLVVFWNRRR